MEIKNKKRAGEWRTIIKGFLLFIVMLIVLKIPTSYLTKIHLIWAAIIILVVLISTGYDRVNDKIDNIADKLSLIDKEKNKLGEVLGDYGIGYIRPKDIRSDRIHTEEIRAGAIYIANCVKIIRKGNTPYLSIYENNEEYGTVIGIRELIKLLRLLKEKELSLEEHSEKNFISREITKKEQRIKKFEEYKKDKDCNVTEVENWIKEEEEEMAELKKWLDEILERDKIYNNAFFVDFLRSQ